MADHKMKSMKLTKKQAKESEEGIMDEPEYPYGLSINLENESMEKLGMDGLPDIGKEMILNARVTVTHINESASNRDKKLHRSMSLQITDMELFVEKKGKEAVEILYGNG